MRATWLGLFDYVKALELQTAIQKTAEAEPIILGLEHPTTITLGRRGDPLKDVLVGFKTLREKQIPVVAVDRGGQATLHHPGQLVIYPMLSLRAFNMGVRTYVELLEDTTKKLLAKHSITACCRGDVPGLYTLKGKIASFGVRISRGITSHGIAINVNNDTREYSMIRSCGKSDETFSKMADFGKFCELTYDLEMLFQQWVGLFKEGVARLSQPTLTDDTPQDTFV